jgi:hypothetical protein
MTSMDELAALVRDLKPRMPERRMLLCGPGVIDSLRDAAAALTAPAQPPPHVHGELDAWLYGIDLVDDDRLDPGEWELVRALDRSVIERGRLR